MDIVTLPLIADVESLDVAIARMNAADRRMIVVASSTGGYRVHRGRAILTGWRARLVAVGELEGGDRVASLRGAENYTGGVPSPAMYPELERLLDRANALFGLVSEPQFGAREVVVVTRHEGITADAQSPTKECVCLRNDGHNGSDPPPTPTPGACPYCGGVWRCA
jgi:hypothetical protein